MRVLFLDVFLQVIFFGCGELRLAHGTFPSDERTRPSSVRFGGGHVIVQVNAKPAFAAGAGSCPTRPLQGPATPRKPLDKGCAGERTAALCSARRRAEAGWSRALQAPCRWGRGGSKGARTQHSSPGAVNTNAVHHGC